jgi:hypothetical protein
VFAPVLDVNNNADNPVINVRSFGEDPEEVARFGVAFIDGLQSEGVLATAKHFPGHGDTNIDSHRGLPIIDHSLQRLGSLELLPFRRAIDAGVASIMIGHIGLPQIDNEEIKPLKNYSISYTEEGADSDKDNRISLVEAYEYATREVARHYQEQGFLMTEHALIDDNGDSKGSAQPDVEAGDGQLARTFALGRPASAAGATNTDDPVMRGLLQERAAIEARLDALRARRTTMEAAEYDRQLEALLVELALKDQEIRRRGGGGGW